MDIKTIPHIPMTLVEKLVGLVQKLLTETRFNKITNIITESRFWAVLASAVLIIIIGITTAIKGGRIEELLISIGIALGLFIVQYFTEKFNESNQKLLDGTKSDLASQILLDILTITGFIAGIAAFIAGLIAWAGGEGFVAFVMLAIVSIILICSAFITNNPKLISLKVVKNQSAGKEFMSILSLMVKFPYRLIPVFYAIMLVAASILLLITLFQLWANSFEAYYNVVFSFQVLVVGGLAPIVGYLVFLLYHLLVDIYQAILSIPDKSSKS